jgi:polyisoprenoid-binding protein YceI
MRLRILCGLVLSASPFAQAQDPLEVDPKHYKVEFENEQVRVVRVHFDPHYRSVMNQTPPG